MKLEHKLHKMLYAAYIFFPKMKFGYLYVFIYIDYVYVYKVVCFIIYEHMKTLFHKDI